MRVIVECLLCVIMTFWNQIDIKIEVFGFILGMVCKTKCIVYGMFVRESEDVCIINIHAFEVASYHSLTNSSEKISMA